MNYPLDNPVISVVMPAYKARFFRDAIESILGQTYSDFELIIVDDASPENLAAIVSSYSDPRIRYFRNAKNIGGSSLVEQWNHSISYAKGFYIVLAADDDVYQPQFLERCLGLGMKYPEVDLIRARTELIGEDDSLLGIDGLVPELCSKYTFLYYWVNATIFTCIGNYMFKADVLKRRNFIDFPFAFGSDVASSIDMAENGVATTSEMLFRFRISTIHLSSSKRYLRQKLTATTLLYNWLFNLNYERPNNRIDKFCYSATDRSILYAKCKYDYYNQVIKFLPLSQIYLIGKCSLLSSRDKMVMFVRYFIDKLFK